MAFGLGASFNEPATDDNTSAPPMPQTSTGTGTPKKKKPFSSKVRNPGALAAAIAKSKRAYQGSHKYGT